MPGRLTPSQVKILSPVNEPFLAPLPGSLRKSQHTKYPSQTLISHITLFAIFLSFSSPPLHPCGFIRPLISVRLFTVCFDVLLGSFIRLVGLVVYLLLNREPKIYGSLRESWIRGCSGSRTIPSAGLLDYEDTRLKTSSRVRIGLSLEIGRAHV